MADIAPIKGLIELQDDFTSRLGLAEAALAQFSKKNQESLTAVAGVAGILTAALGATAYAVIELGKRGSDVNDLRSTIEEFAGGVDQANNIMASLQKGTLGTVTNFNLAENAAHLLSAGVKLTADQFGLLGEAAVVLNNRGLGSTKENLDLVSDALVTGRTRALAMKLGVIENADAEEQFAKKLGISADQLSESGKAEAHRIEVMRLLKTAVTDAGEAEKSFGNYVEAAGVKISNWVDDLGSSIASSKVLEEGFKGVEAAVSNAFGEKQQDSINAVTKAVEQGAITAIGFVQAVVPALKLVESTWYVIKTAVLGVEGAIVKVLEEVVTAIGSVADAAAKLKIISPETAQGVEDLRINIEGMRKSFEDQTAEAARSVVEHTELDGVLDSLSATLGKIKAGMIGAQTATDDHVKVSADLAKTEKDLAAAQDLLNKKFIDGAAVTKALEKSTKELNDIQAEYHAMVVRNSGTSRDAQIADINATFQKQVDALDKLDPLYKQKYDTYQKIAHESLGAVEIDWDSVKDKSTTGLQEMADKALATYNAMLTSSLGFSRGALDEQYKKYQDLQDQVRNYGKSVTDTVTDAANSIQLLDHAWVTDADIAAETLNKTTVMVKTLSGEVISLAEAQKRQQQGFSYTVGAVDQYEIDKTPGGADALLEELRTLGGTLEEKKKTIRDAKDQNDYFAALARYNSLRDSYNLLISQSKKYPKGFAEGGTVMVGEQGPEIVRVPIGSTVYPTGMMPITRGAAGGTVEVHNTWHVNGTGAQVAQQVSEIIMRQLKQARQFGAA